MELNYGIDFQRSRQHYDKGTVNGITYTAYKMRVISSTVTYTGGDFDGSVAKLASLLEAKLSELREEFDRDVSISSNRLIETAPEFIRPPKLSLRVTKRGRPLQKIDVDRIHVFHDISVPF